MQRSKDVDAWFARYDNPMKAVVMRMREIILAADARVGECIKWQAPTFTYQGNIASFFPKSKKHASLMFHQGAHIPGEHSILEGDGATGRFVKIATVEEADAKAEQLTDVIRAWCALRDGTTPRGATTAASRAATQTHNAKKQSTAKKAKSATKTKSAKTSAKTKSAKTKSAKATRAKRKAPN